MKSRRVLFVGICASVGMLILILDSRTALDGTAAGVELCVKTVVPSLFPFFVLSILLTGAITGARLPLLAPIGRLCGIPEGTESILLAGLLGGYPVGAQCVGQAYSTGQLSRSDARRMLGFCNNAGPAFLFGMVGSLFSSPITAFILWAIHIICALIVGMILPGKCDHTSVTPPAAPVTLSHALNRSIRIMAGVCGWVVLFRVVLAFAERWFLWLLPAQWQILLSGVLELANGCFELRSISDERIRFLFASLFLGFGGICVGMQTMSVTNQAGLDTGFYFPGKILQTCISILIALPVSRLLFPSQDRVDAIYLLIPLVIGGMVIFVLKKRKNNSSILSQTGV